MKKLAALLLVVAVLFSLAPRISRAGGSVAAEFTYSTNDGIYTAQIEGGGKVDTYQLYANASTKMIAGNPTWSPDGDTLAFTADKSDWSGEIDTLHGDKITTIASLPSRATDLFWSPKGDKIAFMMVTGIDETLSFSVGMIIADGSKPPVFIQDNVAGCCVRWTDDNTIAYMSLPGDQPTQATLEPKIQIGNYDGPSLLPQNVSQEETHALHWTTGLPVFAREWDPTKTFLAVIQGGNNPRVAPNLWVDTLFILDTKGNELTYLDGVTSYGSWSNRYR